MLIEKGTNQEFRRWLSRASFSILTVPNDGELLAAYTKCQAVSCGTVLGRAYHVEGKVKSENCQAI